MAERVPMMACGDGIARADCGAWGKGPKVKTASYTILPGEVGTIFTNRGAGGAITLTLPKPKAGAWLTFLKQTAQNVLIAATGGAKIQDSAADKKYQNTAAETTASLTILSDGTDWLIMSSSGTWAKNDA